MGDTATQVDDYPYVDAMKKIEEAANKILNEKIFFSRKKTTFFNTYDWRTLVYIINDDYADIKSLNSKFPSKFEKDAV